MISKADAKELARAECGRRGLPFAEPVLVSRRGLRRYSVWTDGRMRGGNVRRADARGYHSNYMSINRVDRIPRMLVP
jgi:hypothetical protein